jgi:hypothetical protein
MKISPSLTREALLAYKEVALRNITQSVRQIRVQVIDKALQFFK